MYLYPSVTLTVQLKLEIYRSSLYHKHSGERGIVSDKKKTFVRADCFAKSQKVPIYYTKDIGESLTFRFLYTSFCITLPNGVTYLLPCDC